MIDELDRSLERWLRAAVPLPANVAEIGFDAPEKDWDARRSTPLVDLFLYTVGPSKDRTHAGGRTVARPDGGLARVRETPVLEARYLISVWGGGAAVEHDLLGRVVHLLAAARTIPSEHLGDQLRAARPGLTLSLAPDETTTPTQLWTALSVPPRPAIQLLVQTPTGIPVPTAAADPPSSLQLLATDRWSGPAALGRRRRSFDRPDAAPVDARTAVRGAVVQDSARRSPATSSTEVLDQRGGGSGV